jgi:hypothetical protein
MTYMNYSVSFRRTRTHFLKGGGRDEGGNAIQKYFGTIKIIYVNAFTASSLFTISQGEESFFMSLS